MSKIVIRFFNLSGSTLCANFGHISDNSKRQIDNYIDNYIELELHKNTSGYDNEIALQKNVLVNGSYIIDGSNDIIFFNNILTDEMCLYLPDWFCLYYGDSNDSDSVSMDYYSICDDSSSVSDMDYDDYNENI